MTTLILNQSKSFFNSLKGSKQLKYSYFQSYIRHISFSNETILKKFLSESDLKIYDDEENKKELEEWLEMRRSEGKYVPEDLPEEYFYMLLDARTLQQRKNILSHKLRREKLAEKNIASKEKYKQSKKVREEILRKSHIKYGLWRNSIFAKVMGQTVTNLYSHRLASAIIHSQPLIIDLSFEENMNLIEKKVLCREILSSIKFNLRKREPLNLMLCNVKPDITLQNVEKFLPQSFPMIISPKSYLELFPKEKLIYLTKDATDEMTEFNHEAIYIIGGLVDHGLKCSITYQKAKQEGILSQRLPLTR